MPRLTARQARLLSFQASRLALLGLDTPLPPRPMSRSPYLLNITALVRWSGHPNPNLWTDQHGLALSCYEPLVPRLEHHHDATSILSLLRRGLDVQIIHQKEKP